MCLQYELHKVDAIVDGLPSETRFVTSEPRPSGTLFNHWVWVPRTALPERKPALAS